MKRALLIACSLAITVGGLSLMAPGIAAATNETLTGSVDAAGVKYVNLPFEVTRTGRISASLDWVNSSANLNLFLKDPSGTQVASSASARKPEILQFNATVTGTWKVAVKAVSGSSSFTVDVEHSLESEPPPPTSNTFAGSVDSGGVKYVTFPFDVSRVGAIDVVLDWQNASANLNLFLKDPSGAQVASSASSRKPEQLTFEATSTGTWRVAVKAVSGVSSFTVTVEHSRVPDPPDPPAGTDWPMFHGGPTHGGVSTELGINSVTAPSLGLDWQANTGQAAYTSPAVVYDATLGKSLVYVGNSVGTMAAYDAATGDRVWWYKTGAGINSSPAVVNGVVYFGSSDEYLYALDARTGALVCRFFTDGVISSSPVVESVGSQGLVAFFGDNGITGGDDGGTFWAINAVDPNAAQNCSLKWQYDGFGVPEGSHPEAGSWSPPAIATDSSGKQLVVFGSSSTDNAVYALDAITGQKVWRFQTEVFFPDNDVGAGPTISAPGVNGFADGVAYVAGKNRIVYALNLRTGAKIWEFRIRNDTAPNGGATRSTAGLSGNRLFIGYGSGLYALNATTGAKLWKSTDAAEIVASPAIAGDAGAQVVLAGDFAGRLLAYDASSGDLRWSYSTGGFIYGSPVIAAGKVFQASSDGFLYAFEPGATNSGKPTTSITSPSEGQTIPHPGGSLTVSGAATDDQGVTEVLVGVKNKNTNKWWDAAEQKWSPIFQQSVANLSSPNSASTNWNLEFPLPDSGGVYFAQAEAVDAGGQHDPTVATRNFNVTSLGNPPETAITSPSFAQVIHFPTDCHCQPINVTVSGTATDAAGAMRGIEKVNVVIKNIEHGEYYCGSAGCATGGGESSAWVPTYTVLTASLTNPGGNSTNWNLTFPTYDHEHKYRLVAWAVDRDNEADQTKAVVGRICVRDPGNNACV